MFDFFQTYLILGFKHIVDLSGFDHILFIITLCAVYRPTEWRKVTILITAFTIGHSATLALAAYRIVVPNGYLIEILIPITILASSIFNLLAKGSDSNPRLMIKYALALCFGLIHGMGFSNFFNLLMGDTANIVFPLFSFNVGIEIGQLIIVGMYYGFYMLIMKLTTFPHNRFVQLFSGLGVITSIILIFERI